jgi:hypothetical protein
MQLVRIELLRAAAKLRALQLAQQMLQAVILRLQVIALRDHGVALGACFQKQRPISVGSSSVLWLTQMESDSRARCDQIMHR